MRNISDYYLGERGKDYISSHNFEKYAPGRAWQCKKYFAPHVGPEDVILDLGANDGFMLTQLDCKKRIGVEANPHSRNSAPSGIEFHEDFTAVPDAAIDVVISNHCLEHIPMPYLALKEIFRVLKPEGKLILVTPMDNMYRHWNQEDIDRHLYTWTPLNIGNLLTEAGFEIKKIQLSRIAWSPRFFFLLRFEKVFRLTCKIWSRLKGIQEVYAVAVANKE